MDIGEILVAKGVVSCAQRDTARAEGGRTGKDIIAVLSAMQAAPEAAMVQALADHYGLKAVDLRQVSIHPDAVAKVPAKFARHYQIMPLAIGVEGLVIAVSDPADRWVVDDLQTTVGMRVNRSVALSRQISEAIEHHYGVGADTIERILDEDRDSGEIQIVFGGEAAVEDLEKMAKDASVVRLVNEVVQQAIAERATDIHLESFPDEAKLRYRVDGVLRDARVSGDIRYLYPAIVSRIKIMSSLDIIERRVPQDGRAKVKIGALEYDLRVSIMPTINGENMVVRILPTSMLLSLTDLGLADDDLLVLDELIHQPNGIIFVTGPTGSGKSTSLYASLKKLNHAEVKLVTIEDPVEYALRGVSQVQVNPRTGLSFARALRSMLRHDPDVIMVGEIRDLETATIATRAALTGHLVLSTLHTNSAAAGPARLIDIGIEPYLVSSSVRAFIGQRLVRVVCPRCREACELTAETLRRLGAEGSEKVVGYRGRGCDACAHTGYRGRTGIYEILTVDGIIRKLITNKAPADEIRQAARNQGIPSMLDDGFRKIVAGVTTADEVFRVAQLEE